MEYIIEANGQIEASTLENSDDKARAFFSEGNSYMECTVYRPPSCPVRCIKFES